MKRIFIVLAATLTMVFGVAGTSIGHANRITVTEACDTTTGLVNVQWSVWNDYGLTETLSAATRVPDQIDGVVLVKTDGDQNNGGDDTLVATESVPANAGTLVLTVTGTWSDRYHQTDSASVAVDANCTKTIVKPKLAHLRVTKYNSCMAHHPYVVVTKRDHMSNVSITHNARWTRFVVKGHAAPRHVLHKHRNGTGKLVHHIKWVVPVNRYPYCGPNTPSS